MKWREFHENAGMLGDFARDRLMTPGVVLVGTVRRDGSPRLSAVEPFLLDDELWLSMLWDSRKAIDLARDNRLLVHSIITSRDGEPGEVKLRGRAIPVEDPEQRRRYCDAVRVLGWQPEEPYFHLFRVDIDEVTVIRYGRNGDQYVARWPERAEYVRRATSATSVGAREPDRHLLA